MKLRMMMVSLVALMGVACGGTVEEATGEQETAALAQQAPGEESIGGGGACGTRICGKGTFCCNPGCNGGICAPVGGGCPDVMCD